jgi:hypothetical protein
VIGNQDPASPDEAATDLQLTVPHAEFDRVQRILRFRELRALRLTGTVPPDLGGSAAALPPRLDETAANEVRRVQVAILRLGERGRCRWVRSRRRAGFRRIARDDGRCNEGVWLRARGVDPWRFTLPSGLPAGRYAVYVRAVNRAGVTDTTFSRRERNRVLVVVR